MVEGSLVKTVGERNARLNFIKEVSGDKSVSWQKLSYAYFPVDYYYCNTDDGIKGVFATIHMYWPEIYYFLAFLNPVERDVFVLNTCMLQEGMGVHLLTLLKGVNPKMQLFFAKQERDAVSNRCTNFLSDVGNFGFMTSKSERKMFQYKDKGLLEAIAKGFDEVEYNE